MINRDKTKLKYGYYPETLSKTSNKKVVWQCDNLSCNLEKDVPNSYALKKYNNSLKSGTDELCQKCSHIHRKGVHVKNEIKKYVPQQLPSQVDIFQTIEKYGINPQELSPWSRQKVILRCDCGKFSETKRCSLNTSKSILETGNYKCIGCWTKERRIGKKLSKETKKKMSDAQIKRRCSIKKDNIKLKPAANGDFNNNKKMFNSQILDFKKKNNNVK